MSGLNNDDDDALDNVDSLISKIKGDKKNEVVQKPKETADLPQTSTAGDRSTSQIGDFDILRKKMEESKELIRRGLTCPSGNQQNLHAREHPLRFRTILSFPMQMICRKQPVNLLSSHKNLLPNMVT